MIVAQTRITIRKYEGDDRYSWALFVDGRPAMTGMGHAQAQYERDQLRKIQGHK